MVDSGSEVEDEDTQPSSQCRSSTPQPSTSTSRKGPGKKSKSKEGDKEADVLVGKLAEQQEVSGRLQSRIQSMLNNADAATSSRAAWGGGLVGSNDALPA